MGTIISINYVFAMKDVLNINTVIITLITSLIYMLTLLDFYITYLRISNLQIKIFTTTFLLVSFLIICNPSQ